MLLLLFRAGKDRFGLDTSTVVEVIPSPVLRDVPAAPPYVSGLFDYGRTVVPVIDVSALIGGQPARLLLSTRIAIVRYREAHLLGLLLEHATETLSCRAEDLSQPGVEIDAAPYLGPVLRGPEGLLQCVTPDQLLPEPVRERLFNRHE